MQGGVVVCATAVMQAVWGAGVKAVCSALGTRLRRIAACSFSVGNRIGGSKCRLLHEESKDSRRKVRRKSRFH